ncbi:MAG: hypothetical protein ACK5O2_02750 [Microthrixaceae bacterium]
MTSGGEHGHGRLQGDPARLEWLRQAYYGLDGRWYLKLRERLGPEVAQEVDEAVCDSLGRLHLRTWLELTDRSSISDCVELGEFVLDVLGLLYGSGELPVEVVESTPNRWVMEHLRCTIFEMGAAAGYSDAGPVPGQLPGCGGIRALYSSWATAAGNFEVRQLARVGEDRPLACRYEFVTAEAHPKVLYV